VERSEEGMERGWANDGEFYLGDRGDVYKLTDM
jgi:hypothetical protein